MTRRTLRLIVTVVLVALLALPVPALASGMDWRLDTERHARVDAAGAERVEVSTRAAGAWCA